MVNLHNLVFPGKQDSVAHQNELGLCRSLSVAHPEGPRLCKSLSFAHPEASGLCRSLSVAHPNRPVLGYCCPQFRLVNLVTI